MPVSTGQLGFGLVSTFTGTAVPYSLGQAFRPGDVKAGSSLTPSSGSLQVTIKNRWPDGSAKFAVLAGRVDLTGGVPLRLALVASASAPANSALALSSLKAAAGTAVIDAGSFGRAQWATTAWDAPFAQWVSGPEMSCWLYRQPLGTDPHLVAWLEIRLYAGGAVEALPWIENGYLNVNSPVNKAATFSFTWGGSVRFSRAIDLPHHCRTPLLDGAALSHWLGADPAVTVRHDVVYLQATELTPSYHAKVAVTADVVKQLVATYSPLQQGNFDYAGDSMASGGYASPIGLLPQHDVLYLSSDATSAYAAVLRNGFSAGRYGLHYRDETTQRPLRFSKYPNLVLKGGSAIKDSGSSTINQFTPQCAGTPPVAWDPAHSPSVGYMAYLLTGRWFFMEQVQFAATLHYLWNTDTAVRRNFSQGLMRPVPGAVQTRSTAWTIRTLAQALTVTPDDDTDLRTEFTASVESNIRFFHATYVTQPNNPFGLLSNDDYGGASFMRSSPWMNDFCVGAFGYALSMGLPVSASVSQKLTEFFAWLAGSAVGRLGPAGSFWYINGAPYTLAYSPSKTPDFEGGKGPWYRDWRAVYDATYGFYAGQPWIGSTEGTLAGEIVPGATAYWGNLQPAIAYAVRHGVPGAFDAYRRLQRAQNWPALVTAFNQSPVWGVKPAAIAAKRRPAWLTGVPLNRWIAIPGTVLAGSAAAPGENPGNLFAASNNIVRAYSGMALREDTSEIYLAAAGGHGDSSDNAVRSIALAQDQPAWELRSPASAGADRRADAPYYADGKPSSRHLYWSSHWSSLRGRVMLHRTRFAYGSAQSFDESNGFDPETGRWDARGSWSNGYSAQCRDDQDNIWAAVGTSLYRWSSATDQWKLTAKFTGAEFPQGPIAWDSTRKQLFALAWGDGQGFGSNSINAWAVNQDGTQRQAISFSASPALSQFTLDRPAYAALEFDPDNDRFLFYAGQAGATQRVYVVTPAAGSQWSLDFLPFESGSITPLDAGTGGLMNKFRYVPALGGFVLLSSAIDTLYFIRTV